MYSSVYLETKVELLERASDLSGEVVHPLTLLQSHQNIGSLVLCAGRELHHGELLRQFLQNFIKD